MRLCFSLDPNNRDAVNQLVALGDVSGENKELDQSASSSQFNETQPDPLDTNAEMVDTQQLSPPSEMLPSLDEEDDTNGW